MQVFNIFDHLIVKALQRLTSSYKFREYLHHNIRDLFVQSFQSNASTLQLHQVPAQYDLNGGQPELHTHCPAVFITARFRSGSTFLWQVFRHIKGITAYYEPLNEGRWTDKSRGPSVDPTHINVNDYDAEFEELRHLKQIFLPTWTDRFLYMNGTHHNPGMLQYLSTLIENADGLAVLQFNRMDFRLEWLKANFPASKILHLYRAPREQWMSIINKGDHIGQDAVYQRHQIDGGNDFYTLEWARDLRHVFPFLEPDGRHPYEIHYLLWRLSYSFGKSFSDISIGYEDLIKNFSHVLGRMNEVLDLHLTGRDINNLTSLNKGAIKSRWKNYASEKWFRNIEDKCDREIEMFFSFL